jgi:hypothetical protein
MEKDSLVGRKILVQRVTPLKYKWRKRFPRMRKFVYRPEGKLIIPSDITNQKELIGFLYDRLGKGTYQLLAWRQRPMRKRDEEGKIISKEKAFPFFKVSKCMIVNERVGKFYDSSRLKRTFFKGEDEKYFED